MNLKITFASYTSQTMGGLINTIDEVGNLYELNGIAFEYDMFITATGYKVKFKLYG